MPTSSPVRGGRRRSGSGLDPLFLASGRDYVHDTAFLTSLDYVASHPRDRRWKAAWRPTWPVIAAAWRSHLAADEVAHRQYVPPDSPRHDLVELAVDTCVYYQKPVPESLGIPGGR